MLRKIIIAIAGVLTVTIMSPFWYPQVEEHIVAYLMIQNDASDQSSELQQPVILRILKPLPSISHPVQKSFMSFTYEVPVEFKNVKESSYGLVYTLSETDKSKFIMVRKGFSLDSLMYDMKSEEKELISGTNNYESNHSILMIVPNDISWFDSPTQAKKNILLMGLKQVKLASSPGGSYEFENKKNIRGLEIRGQLTEVEMFDALDNSISFSFKGMSQSEIDSFLESVSSN